MKNINIDGTDYKLVPVDTTTEEEIKSTLFYPNGAVVYQPEYNQEYWYFDAAAPVDRSHWEDHPTDICHLRSQQMFLTEEACQNAKDVDDTHNRLLTKIVEINAENNWILDWSDSEQVKYWLGWDYRDGRKYSTGGRQLDYSTSVMCIQANDYMMSDQVSDADFKKFLKIYN